MRRGESRTRGSSADGKGVVTFFVPVSLGLGLEDLKALLPEKVREVALVRRKPMTDEELEEAMREPYEADPKAAEEDTLKGELTWKLNTRRTYLVGDMWGWATLSRQQRVGGYLTTSVGAPPTTSPASTVASRGKDVFRMQ